MPEKPIQQEFVDLVKNGKEPIVAFLGTKLLEIGPGYARVKITIMPEHLNFYGVAFGGIIMSLADKAFGYAVNSLSYPSLAIQFTTYFLASARTGDELTAEARVIKSGRRLSMAEVTVTNQEGKLIATANGTDLSVEKTQNGA
jgi:acyl-CoA thioesterase